MNDEALRDRVMEEGAAEVVEIAKELGFDMTVEELEEAMKALRQAAMQETKELSLEEMDQAAGGTFWGGEDAPDGHEMGCLASYHHEKKCLAEGWYCSSKYYAPNIPNVRPTENPETPEPRPIRH